MSEQQNQETITKTLNFLKKLERKLDALLTLELGENECLKGWLKDVRKIIAILDGMPVKLCIDINLPSRKTELRFNRFSIDLGENLKMEEITYNFLAYKITDNIKSIFEMLKSDLKNCEH